MLTAGRSLLVTSAAIAAALAGGIGGCALVIGADFGDKTLAGAGGSSTADGSVSTSSTGTSTSSTGTSTSNDASAVPITRVQMSYPMQWVQGTTISQTIDQTAGNTLVVAALQQLGGATVTVTDTKNSAWHPLTSYGNLVCGTANGHYSGAQIWYANDIASGSNTVSMTVGGGMDDLWLVVVEYAGLTTAAPVSNGVVASTSTAAMSAGVVMTTADRSLVVGLFHDASQEGPMTPGPGFTKIAEQTDLAAMLEDNVDVLSGDTTPTAQASGPADDCWVAVAAAFEGN
jgi:hypothetical protein